MRVTLSAPSRFHYFDLAQQLEARNHLQQIYTGYPRWKLKALGVRHERIKTFPWIHAAFMATQRLGLHNQKSIELIDSFDRLTFDRHVASCLEDTDIFTAISGCGLLSGRTAKLLGAKYVCDRGSTHIQHQLNVLREEHTEWGMPFTPTHERIVERELNEYQEADLITVPSDYSKKTFIEHGIDESKIKSIRYGADINQFYPTEYREKRELIVAYIGGINIRKGIQYLFQAFSKIEARNKKLWLIGQADEAFVDRLRNLNMIPREAVFFGHVMQSELRDRLSQARVLVLPSIEDGFGLVVAQALACGCPAIVTDCSGSAELIENGKNGYVVPSRNVDALADAINKVVESKSYILMRHSARSKVEDIGGWSQYGDIVTSTYEYLLKA